MRIAAGMHHGPPESMKRLRVEVLGFTQMQLAEALFTTPSTVSNWETGSSPVHPAFLMALCALAGEPFDRWYPEPPPKPVTDAQMVQSLEHEAKKI